MPKVKKKLKKKPVKRIEAWSYSRLKQYRTCPRQSKLAVIDKLPRSGTPGPALVRGGEAHTYLQSVTTGIAKPNRREFRWATKQLLEIVGYHEFDVERQWAVTRRWEEAEWYARNTWLRVVIDFVAYDGDTRMMVVDHKTGKVREEETLEQLSLYALVTLVIFPKLEEVVAAAWFVDHELEIKATWERKQLPELKKYWLYESKKLLADRSFAPSPSNVCRWCDFSKAKGGPCEY